jgi:rhamnopyranosyl-N-acetylglucosaminyl-diphospho-decaprenol beta-1,3/1,4-galactofuranosyltransferase
MNETLQMKILAVIVTHNRCALLSRCIDHLQIQTRQTQDILVVNNASTDGTVDMLEQRKVPYVTQENVGSAGGWHRGIQHAVDQGFDAVWLMDDDGFPDTSSLAALEIRLIPGVVAVSAVVVREDDPTRFVFPFPVLNKTDLPVLIGVPRKLGTLAELKAIATNGIYPFAHFFNGVLVSIAAIKQTGNVNRDFFIYGEEVDFFFRLRKVGKVISVLDAIHYHPDVSGRSYNIIKSYYYIKNTLILNSLYYSLAWPRHIIMILIIIKRILRRNGFLFVFNLVFGMSAPIFIRAIHRGLMGKIGKDFDV